MLWLSAHSVLVPKVEYVTSHIQLQNHRHLDGQQIVLPHWLGVNAVLLGAIVHRRHYC